MEGNYFIIATNEEAQRKKSAILLYADELDELPYKELHWEKIPGRWLGRGQVEKLFHAQIYLNKIATYKAHGAHWTSKHIYQTRDETIEKNLLTEVEDGEILRTYLLTEVEDGEILRTYDGIAPIPVEERNLPFYREEEDRWDFLIDKRTFAWDVTRGQRPPAGLTLGQSIIQTQMASGYFDLKREELGLFLKEVFYDWVIPEFKKQRNRLHKLSLQEFSEDEIEKLRKLSIEGKLNESIVNFVSRTGRYPSLGERNILRSVVKEQVKKEKEIEIPAKYYDNLKYKIDIIITSEQIDVAARMATLQTVLVMLAQNPTILQDPTTRKVFYQLLDLAGISPTEFEARREEPGLEEAVMQAQRGGSVAKLPPIPTPTEIQVPRKL